MKNILTWLIVIIWLIIIYILSAMPANISGTKSKLVLENSINIVNKISNNSLTSLNNKKIINKIHPYFRKLMHVMVYFILSILFILALNNTIINKYKIYLITILLCIIYAISDEYHQSMVIGRSCRLLDVLIDSIGVFIGCFIYYIKSLLKL